MSKKRWLNNVKAIEKFKLKAVSNQSRTDTSSLSYWWRSPWITNCLTSYTLIWTFMCDSSHSIYLNACSQQLCNEYCMYSIGIDCLSSSLPFSFQPAIPHLQLTSWRHVMTVCWCTTALEEEMERRALIYFSIVRSTPSHFLCFFLIA